MNIQILICLILSTVIYACGGGGAPQNVVPSPIKPTTSYPDASPQISENGLDIFTQDNFVVGQSVSLAARASNGSSLSDPHWQQTMGPVVPLFAFHTQVVAFDLPAAGDYLFEFSAVNSDGQNINQSIALQVNEASQISANIRLDHAAVEQAKVSLRVDGESGKEIDSILWQQIAGTSATDFQPQDNYLFFNAPDVDADTILEFTATINYTDGSSSEDSSYVLVKNTAINAQGYFPKYNEQVVSTDVFAYRPDSPYADVLVDCVYNNKIDNSCAFSNLPLIGKQRTSPTVDYILDRLVVSHQWMGDRFKQFLEQSQTSDDMRKLLRATTAIVISYDVRPSFYWTATGAIYLDANNFWVTPQERDTLNDQPDYRSNFGNDLKFIIPWRYVKNNDYYFRNSEYPAAERLTKSFADLEANVSWLMYHELGHANDFFPPQSWSQLSSNTSPLGYANQVASTSSSFSQQYPLVSTEMKALAQVSFAGETATSTQKAYMADDVVSFFEPDMAPAYYSYSTVREDYATLFERFMMSYRLGVSADVAIISDVNNNDLLVTWGQRDRFNSPEIQPRVRRVVENILPDLDVLAIQADLPAPKLMSPGRDWFENLNLTEQGQKQAKAAKKYDIDSDDIWLEYRHGPDTPQN